MRLIDADALKRDLKSVTLSNGTLVNANTILALLDKYPTAYDPDKVIDLIETKILGKVCIGCGYLRNNVCTYKGSNCGVSKPMYEDIKKVFDEVKGGGADE